MYYLAAPIIIMQLFSYLGNYEQFKKLHYVMNSIHTNRFPAASQEYGPRHRGNYQQNI